MVTAYEDGSHRLEDHDLLDRAHELGRVLFSNDDDLLKEAATRQRAGVDFSGVVYVHQSHLPTGRVINDLEILAEVGELGEMVGRVVFLPL